MNGFRNKMCSKLIYLHDICLKFKAKFNIKINTIRQEPYKLCNSNFNKNDQHEDKFQINFSKYHINLKKLRNAVNEWSFHISAEKKQYQNILFKKMEKAFKGKEERAPTGKLQGLYCVICSYSNTFSSQIAVFKSNRK